LATFIADYKLFNIEISKNYGVAEWREDLKKVLLQAGSMGQQSVFLFSDTQLKDESFLEDINNILNTGKSAQAAEIPRLPDSLLHLSENTPTPLSIPPTRSKTLPHLSKTLQHISRTSHISQIHSYLPCKHSPTSQKHSHTP
jgi:hypothetical protein